MRLLDGPTVLWSAENIDGGIRWRIFEKGFVEYWIYADKMEKFRSVKNYIYIYIYVYIFENFHCIKINDP